MAMRARRPKTAPAGIKQSVLKDAACPYPPVPPPPPKPLVPVRTKQALHEASSFPRPDATTHYPFLDSKATALSAITATTPTPHIYTIGIPQRKRLAARVYAESLTTAAGMPLANVPEALQSLGIHMPRGLERAFLLRSLAAQGLGAAAGVAAAESREEQKARGGGGAGGVSSEDKGQPQPGAGSPGSDSGAAAGAVAGAGAGAGTSPPRASEREPMLSLPQWLNLVDRYVDRENRMASLINRSNRMALLATSSSLSVPQSAQSALMAHAR